MEKISLELGLKCVDFFFLLFSKKLPSHLEIVLIKLGLDSLSFN